MVGVVLCLFSSNKSSSGTAMMSVSNIQSGHLFKLFCYSSNIVIVVDNPKLMTKSIIRSDKIVFGLCGCMTHDNLVEHRVVWISKEYRLNIGIVHANMLHTVFLFVTACQLMLLYHTIKIVVHISTHNKTILSLAVHCLRIYIIRLLLILTQPTFLLEHLEVSGSFLVYTRIILACTWFKVNFRLDNMIKTLLVITSLSSCFLTVKHIVRA